MGVAVTVGVPVIVGVRVEVPVGVRVGQYGLPGVKLARIMKLPGTPSASVVDRMLLLERVLTSGGCPLLLASIHERPEQT